MNMGSVLPVGLWSNTPSAAGAATARKEVREERRSLLGKLERKVMGMLANHDRARTDVLMAKTQRAVH